MTDHALPPGYAALVSNTHDGDIALFHFDAAGDALTAAARYPADTSVMPLAFSADRRTLYAATRGGQPSIVCYDVDLATGQLALRWRAPIASSLAYLSTEPHGRYLLGASYAEHTVSVYALSQLGEGDGTPHQVVPGIEHAHAVLVSPDGRFAYASSLGASVVHAFRLDAAAQGAVLAPLSPVALGAGFGPRHLRLSPDGRTLYALSEFRATVAALARDPQSGQLGEPRHSERPPVLAHLRDGQARPTPSAPVQPDPALLATMVWAAELRVAPDGRFLYLSERTTSRLIVYRVAADGALAYAGCADTETQPRGFNLSPDGRWLVACGEKSTQVALYAVDPASGALSLCTRADGGRGASWVEILAHDGARAPG
jgi:6-phosphogluconolactonase